jgi:hypothetical protein
LFIEIAEAYYSYPANRGYTLLDYISRIGYHLIERRVRQWERR